VNTIDPEFLKALELVAEFDRNRPVLVKELRLYYREDGSIIGLWETDHPEGDYIVLDNADVFNRNNTDRLRVVNGSLKVLDVVKPAVTRLTKATTGQPVVKGHAALALGADEEYTEIEYYDRKATC
jgi:hypothetical protein